VCPTSGLFSTSIIAISICLIIVFLLWAIKFVNKIIPFVLLVVVFSGCSYSKSNQQAQGAIGSLWI
jgi:hypothetical protein